MVPCVGNWARVTRDLTRRANAIPLALLFLLFAGQVNPDTFSSLAGLKNLVGQEKWLLAQLYDSPELKQRPTELLKERIDEISKRSALRKDMSDSDWNDYVTRLVGHPLDAFHLIKVWLEVAQSISSTSTKLFESVTEQARDRGISLPETVDYKGGIVALVRLQKTYKLPTDDLARGVVYNISAAQTLDHKDYMEMGKVLKEKDHSLAITWFEKLLEESNDSRVQLEAHIHIKDIYDKCRDYGKALMSTRQALELDPQNEHLKGEEQRFSEATEQHGRQVDTPRPCRYWRSAKSRSLEHYEALCRGDHITNVITVNKDLMCIYRTGILPYIRYKEEIHSFDPRISLFIDVISDRQADILKAIAYPSLYRARIGGPSSRRVSDGRISKLTWLFDTDEEVKRNSQKVADITGLDTQYREQYSSADAFQIVNYGLGGQYEPHTDFYVDPRGLLKVPSFVLGSGDRIATFMYYLSDVQAGGATVFPNIGVRIPPVKNAAAFWYNFRLHGVTGDLRTTHAGCPVLLGEKWVGNKWIRQRNQIFKRPCGLSRNQVDPVWYT